MIRGLILKMSERPVGVIFGTRRENDDFVEFCHFFEELVSLGSNQNCVSLLVVVYKGLVQIQHKSVFFVASNLRQERYFDIRRDRVAALSLIATHILKIKISKE